MPHDFPDRRLRPAARFLNKIRKTAPAVLLSVLLAAVFLSCAQTQAPAAPQEAPQKTPVEDAPGFWEITEMIDTAADGQTVCSCALYEESTLLLLTGTAEGDFAVSRLDLTDGSASLLYTFANASDSDTVPAFLSLHPLIVFDAEAGILYRPEEGAAPIRTGDPAADTEPAVVDGQVFLASPKGILYCAENDGTLTEYWRLPYRFTSMMLQPAQADGHLVFKTYPENAPDLQIFADLEVSTGTVSCYTQEQEDLYLGTYSDGRWCALSLDRAPSIRLYAPEQALSFTIPFPESIAALTVDEETSFFADPAERKSLSPLLPFHPVQGDTLLFTLADIKGHPVRTYLCCLSAQGEGTSWQPPSRTEWVFPESDYGELTQRAAQIRERYGVNVVLGENVPSLFPEYEVGQESQYPVMQSGLDALESALALYPDGYFRKLRSLHYREIIFYLTGTMRLRSPGDHIEDAGAFTLDRGGVGKVALNLDAGLFRGIIVHEITHLTDYALLEEGLLPEEEWLALCPPDFAYYERYLDETGTSYELSGDPGYTADAEDDPEKIWFLDLYSKTFSLEDRAQLMEILLREGPPAPAFRSSHLQAKVRWYADLLRRTLGTPEWPEKTSWETALDRVSE